MGDILVLAISCIFVNNILLAQYLGNCPFLGVSKKMETATGMAMAVIFVLVMAGAITWLTSAYILKPFGFEYLQTLSFILVIAALVQFVEMFLRKSIPGLYAGLGIFLPLITTNCAVMGVCLINIKEDYDFIETLILVIQLCGRIWIGADIICCGSRADPSFQGSEAVAGHLHRAGDCRDVVPCLFCL